MRINLKLLNLLNLRDVVILFLPKKQLATITVTAKELSKNEANMSSHVEVHFFVAWIESNEIEWKKSFDNRAENEKVNEKWIGWKV